MLPGSAETKMSLVSEETAVIFSMDATTSPGIKAAAAGAGAARAQVAEKPMEASARMLNCMVSSSDCKLLNC